MQMKLEVFNTRDLRILAAARDLERRLSREFGQGHVSVVLVNNPQIHALNRRFLGHDRPTDVMAFPSGEPDSRRARQPDSRTARKPESQTARKPDSRKTALSGCSLSGCQASSLGEVYVSRDQSRLQAREYGLSYHDEVKRLILHGVLHLLGLSHREMEPYYRRFLERAKSEGRS